MDPVPLSTGESSLPVSHLSPAPAGRVAHPSTTSSQRLSFALDSGSDTMNTKAAHPMIAQRDCPIKESEGCGERCPHVRVSGFTMSEERASNEDSESDREAAREIMASFSSLEIPQAPHARNTSCIEGSLACDCVNFSDAGKTPAKPELLFSRTSSLNANAMEYIPASSPIRPQTEAQLSLAISMPPSPGLVSPSPPLSCSVADHMPQLSPPPPPPFPRLLNIQLHGAPAPLRMPSPTCMSPVLPLVTSGHIESNSFHDIASNQSTSMDDFIVQDHSLPQNIYPNSTQAGNAKHQLNDDLRAKIVKQVEFYFSDTNLPTDHYLMKFVKKDPEGFVPISIVASFRRVKQLVKNHALVATALRSSKELVVSEDGKKVRRSNVLPHIDLEEIQSRTVVAENLPEDHSVQALEKLFEAIGKVRMIRVCQPEGANGANQTLAKFTKTDMVISNKLHAMIEYDSVEHAERAVTQLTDQRNWRSGLHVRLLLRRTGKHGIQQQSIVSRSPNNGDGGDGSENEEENVLLSDVLVEKAVDDNRMDDKGADFKAHNEPSKRGRGRGRGRGWGRGQFHHNVSGRGHPIGTPPQSSGFSIESKPLAVPRMPDGTRGFTFGRGKAPTPAL